MGRGRRGHAVGVGALGGGAAALNRRVVTAGGVRLVADLVRVAGALGRGDGLVGAVLVGEAVDVLGVGVGVLLLLEEGLLVAGADGVVGFRHHARLARAAFGGPVYVGLLVKLAVALVAVYAAAGGAGGGESELCLLGAERGRACVVVAVGAEFGLRGRSEIRAAAVVGAVDGARGCGMRVSAGIRKGVDITTREVMKARPWMRQV